MQKAASLLVVLTLIVVIFSGCIGETENRAPIAKGTGPASANVGAEVAFNASNSSDLDGDCLTYTWDFGDNTIGTSINPKHTYASAGNYTVILTVNDGHGHTSEEIFTIIVNPLPVNNTAPTVNITAPDSTNVVANVDVQNWSMFGHDPYNTGYSPTTAPNSDSISWHSSGGGLSSPVVHNGYIFIGISDSLTKIDGGTGSIVWQFDTSGYIETTPAVAEGLALVSCQSGKIYAVNENDGRPVWDYTISNYVVSSPTVANGKVFVGGGGYSSGNNSWKKVYALDLKDGHLLWSYETGGDVRYPPAIKDGVVYVCSEGISSSYPGKIFALDENNGTVLWEVPLPELYPRSPAVEYGKVFTTCVHYVVAASIQYKTEMWRYHIGTYVVSKPTVAYNKVFVGGGTYPDKPGVVVALDQVTGNKIWNFTTEGRVDGSLAVADGKVFVCSHGSSSRTGHLYVLDESTGGLIWSHLFSVDVATSPAIAQGRLFVNADGLYAFYDGRPVTTSQYNSTDMNKNTTDVAKLLITSDTIWTKENSPYLIAQDLTVCNGSTLTIEPGTIIKLESADEISNSFDTNDTDLIIKGSLIAIGKDNSKIIFTSNKKNCSMGDWGSIHFENHDMVRSILRYCDIEYARIGIDCDQSPVLKISNCDISKSINGMYINRCSPQIEMANCTIHDCADNGIFSWSGSFNASGNNIWNCKYGIYESEEASDAMVDILYNTIHNCSSFGISCSYGDANIIGNIIRNCGIGIGIDSAYNTSTIQIKHNLFEFNSISIRIWEAHVDICPVINYNIFRNASSYAIEYRARFSSGNTINAEYNYWGTTDSEKIVTMNSGRIDYEPWLNEETI